MILPIGRFWNVLTPGLSIGEHRNIDFALEKKYVIFVEIEYTLLKWDKKHFDKI